MTHEEFKQNLAELGYEETVIFDNPDYDTAFIGVSHNGNAIYDFDKMVEYLNDTDGMNYEEAVEFIEYNTIRAIPYAGEFAPIVMYKLEQLGE